MKTLAFNPYLPSYEYVPDGEPYVFGDRVYVFGSHDRFGGTEFCMNDYVGWSAPVDDLGAWRYEGVIYKATWTGASICSRRTYSGDWTGGITFTIACTGRRRCAWRCVTHRWASTNFTGM